MRRWLPRFARDERGATLIEFAMVAPVMCLLLMGGFDISHTLYTRAALQGIVQKTARDSTLETGTVAAQQQVLDGRVRNQVRAMYIGADIAITRRFYRSFAEAAAAQPETWTDTNNNRRCDNGEPYEDANNNLVWDADGGNAGQGGAKDATLYTVKMTYPRVFPLYRFIGGDDTVTVAASTILRNQPYGEQGKYAPPTTRNCP